MNNNQYLYISGIVGLAVAGYFVYTKLKKPQQQSKSTIKVTPSINDEPKIINTKIHLKKIFLKWNDFFYTINIHRMSTTDYTKDIKESLYHGVVVSGLAVGYTMLGKTLLKMSPPSLGKFDIGDGIKLVAVIAAADMTKDYLVKQKIIPDNI